MCWSNRPLSGSDRHVLTGQVALVSGAGRGIGRGIALALAEAGAQVGVNDSVPDLAAGTVEAITVTGGQAIPLVADVADYEAMEHAVDILTAHFGRIDIAVSNAAFSDREPFHVANLDGFRRTIDVTMWGAFHLLRAATRRMLAQPARSDGQRGSIVIVSSPHAVQPIPEAMAYNMAKAAIDQMARTAAIELVGQRIRVNVLHPGWTDTPGERKFSSEEELRRTAGALPWGRLATPAEIARGVVFFCDPASEYITGSTLLIDGGLSLPWWAVGGTGAPTTAAPPASAASTRRF
ncbi:MAG: SDR family oxidoreductase [Pirellulales bacterium]|nr:SDR family oxidoreductase [Pirellulales bacterium]